MFLPKPSTIFIIFIAFFSASCGACSAPEKTAANTFVAEEIKSSIPFSTKEPDIFQTDIIVTANGAERKYLIARSGAKRLLIFDRGADEEVSLLQTGDGKSFVINAADKTYSQSSLPEKHTSDDLTEYLTTEWLNQRTEAVFTRLGTENNLTTYSVKLSESDNSEILIYFDENLQMPVKQEFYAISGGRKNLTFTFEIKNFQLQTDENMFAIPNGFKQKDK